MTASPSPLRIQTGSRERILGRVESESPGPLLIAVGSIHGNEPAGCTALQAVLARLRSERLLVRGDVLALAGNLPALDAGVRFLDEDLNRHWSREVLDRLSSSTSFDTVEAGERAGLLRELESAMARARGEVVLLDLHTTSGEGTPFAVFADTLRSRSFARRFPVPAVLGLEERLEGTLADYVGLLGHVAVAFEGGQHSDPRSVENLAAMVWLALGLLSMMKPEPAAIGEEKRRLAAATEGAPGIVEVTYRHAIREEDAFRMRPGYRSFEKVESGQVVADDRNGRVAVPSDGYLLMPLYQKLGDDGFFVARRVRGFWLALSALLRHLRAGRAAHWLPGVSRVPGHRHVLRVDRRIARWYSLEILHLLGFRRRKEDGEILLVERRAHDLA